MLGVAFIYGVLHMVAVAPIALGSWYYISFFRDDNAESRQGLVKACMLMIMACAIGAGIVLVQFLIGTAGESLTFGAFLGGVLEQAIPAVIYFYYAGVAKRFASQA